jgi:hypothetical protein
MSEKEIKDKLIIESIEVIGKLLFAIRLLENYGIVKDNERLKSELYNLRNKLLALLET